MLGARDIVATAPPGRETRGERRAVLADLIPMLVAYLKHGIAVGVYAIRASRDDLDMG